MTEKKTVSLQNCICWQIQNASHDASLLDIAWVEPVWLKINRIQWHYSRLTLYSVIMNIERNETKIDVDCNWLIEIIILKIFGVIEKKKEFLANGMNS